MDRAPACGADGCAFDSRRGHFFFKPHRTQYELSEYPKGTYSPRAKYEVPSQLLLDRGVLETLCLFLLHEIPHLYGVHAQFRAALFHWSHTSPRHPQQSIVNKGRLKQLIHLIFPDVMNVSRETNSASPYSFSQRLIVRIGKQGFMWNNKASTPVHTWVWYVAWWSGAYCWLFHVKRRHPKSVIK